MPPKSINKAASKASKSKSTLPKAKKAKTTPKNQPAKGKAPPRPLHPHQSLRKQAQPLPILLLFTPCQTLKRSYSTLTATLTPLQSLRMKKSRSLSLVLLQMSQLSSGILIPFIMYATEMIHLLCPPHTLSAIQL
ncbi:hypothetical protein DSO57_1039768 [Entomophthora muscae]|uniref:Uncharacterized protein n=1 Tax=Entomophthora muscae TaxID=34485 RepID=A0ACC2T6E7_9FUNG|nr:hypothetical protein DSO57_1039768 [Entomophthora muscae]